MAASKPATWLVTGASSGIGKEIALAALRKGNAVLATSRNLTSARESVPEFEKNGGEWVQVDPSASSSAQAFSRVDEDHKIDVLVNNAGFAFLGALEDTSEAEVRQQMEVNYFGPLRAIRAVLPGMRARKRGHIVLISSGAGLVARPSRSSYSASKFAIEAAHESLAAEVAPFGIKVLIVQPGAFRTPFSARVSTPEKYKDSEGLSESYRGGPVAQILEMTKKMTDPAELDRIVKGDPVKAGDVIVNIVTKGHDFLRLPLGSDCVAVVEQKIKTMEKELSEYREMAVSTDIA